MAIPVAFIVVFATMAGAWHWLNATVREASEYSRISQGVAKWLEVRDLRPVLAIRPNQLGVGTVFTFSQSDSLARFSETEFAERDINRFFPMSVAAIRDTLTTQELNSFPNLAEYIWDPQLALESGALAVTVSDDLNFLCNSSVFAIDLMTGALGTVPDCP